MSFFQRLFGAQRREAPPPIGWPDAWLSVLRAPAMWVDAEVISSVAAEAAQRAGFAPPPTHGEPADWVRWASMIGGLPPAATGGIEVFCKRASRTHQLELGLPELQADIHDQMGPGELLEQWALLAAGDDDFWYADTSVAPRLRLVQLSFDYDHLHVRREISCVGELVGSAVAERLAGARAPDDLAPPEVSPRPVALDADALALAFALESMGMPVPDTMAFEVSGIRASARGWALLQLRAANRLRTCRVDLSRLEVASTSDVIEWVPGGESPGPIDGSVADAIRERIEELSSSERDRLAALRRALR